MKTKGKLYAGIGFLAIKSFKVLRNRHVRTVLGDYRRGRKQRVKS